jgi:hypothetical protein
VFESVHWNEQLQFAKEESLEFGCICFRDCWVDQNSAPLDTMYSNGELDLVIIRRCYTQGWWALALRQLGGLVRVAEGK